ncbi:hypothetical protein QKW60_16125 [Defluviimonas aestuarii]|uniref:hypothetical protein n=1 Tax=Albidovulum aestuarii TaxID=1130726 RepID=UPI00249A5AE4|nr:hypothetical protein [Defluviimonas aestuarii]MDI3337937.1 hypothetical protein [Defluviimonas aestuarii]
MMFEYALDPLEVATWGSKEKYSVVVEAFGVGTPRVSVRLPKAWKRLVWQAFAGGSPEDQIRLEEVVNAISEVQARRAYENRSWDSDWLGSAHEEHKSNPFHAIISNRKLDETDACELTFQDLHPRNPTWHLEDRANFTREAEGFFNCFAPLLTLGKQFKLIDANLRPAEARFKNVWQRLLAAAASRHGPENVKVQIFSENSQIHPSWELFERNLRNWPRQVIPAGMVVEFIRLEQIGRERFHDRLVLTELGGAYLPDGLDEEDQPTPGRGRAALLRRTDYARCWDIYRKDGSDFRMENSLTLVGE